MTEFALDKIQVLDNDSVYQLAEKGSQQALQDPSFLAANLLDHRFLGKQLSAEKIADATHYICESSPDSAHAMTMFIAEQSPYNQTALSSDVEPSVWWAAGKRLGFDASLVNVALSLVTAAANRAGLARQFSTLVYKAYVPHP